MSYEFIITFYDGNNKIENIMRILWKWCLRLNNNKNLHQQQQHKKKQEILIKFVENESGFVLIQKSKKKYFYLFSQLQIIRLHKEV